MTFSDLLPADVVAVEDVLAPGTDFGSGRACARAALAALGVQPGPLEVGPDRAPVWPAGVVGSITHAAGVVAAAVAPASSYAGIGVDVEGRVALAPDVVDLVLPLAAEREAAAFLGDDGPVVVFSAKESVYKAWARTGGWLEHGDVALLLGADGGFTARVRGVRIGGRWQIDRSVVRTAAVLLIDSPHGEQDLRRGGHRARPGR